MPMESTTSKQLVIASRNKGKIAEFKKILVPKGIDVRSLWDTDLGTIDETGTTFEQNAILKAQTAAMHLHCPALADDSGLEVDALDGAPGVFSARYGGRDRSDRERTAFLLEQMSKIPVGERAARFVCVLAYVTPYQTHRLFYGRIDGVIETSTAGTNGFGYDPVFRPTGYNVSMATLTASEKNKISHRSQAIGRFVDWFERHGAAHKGTS